MSTYKGPHSYKVLTLLLYQTLCEYAPKVWEPLFDKPFLVKPSSEKSSERYNAPLWPSALNLVSCKTQHLTDQKMSSPVFPCRYSSCPASVTSPLYDVLGQKNHIFSERLYFWKDNCSRISSESRTVMQALEFHSRHLIWSVLYYFQSTFLKLEQLKV